MAFFSVKSNDDSNLMNQDFIDLNTDFYHHIHTSNYSKLHHPTTQLTLPVDYNLPGGHYYPNNYKQTTYAPAEDYYQINNGDGIGFNTAECNEIMSAEVKLEKRHLWEKFDKLVNEMILVKKGRRMFPQLEFEISDLDPTARYCVLIEMSPIGETRFRFKNNQWQPHSSSSAIGLNGKLVEHPDSPNTGEFWMEKSLCFDRLRLSNYYDEDATQNITLSTMHKYQPRLHIVKANAEFPIEGTNYKTFTFPETKFIAVTTYQNPKVVDLKVDNNSCARRFRNEKPHFKRKNVESSKLKTDIKVQNQHKRVKLEDNYAEIASPTKVSSDSQFFATQKLKHIDHYLDDYNSPSSNLPSNYQDTALHTLNYYGNTLESDASWDWPVTSNSSLCNPLYSQYMQDDLSTNHLYL